MGVTINNKSATTEPPPQNGHQPKPRGGGGGLKCILSSELKINKANTSDTEVAVLVLHFSISNDIVSTQIFDERGDFDFEIVNLPFLEGDVPQTTSYGLYISQLIIIARASSHIVDLKLHSL